MNLLAKRMGDARPSPSTAVSQAAKAGDTRHTAAGGRDRTRAAVAEKFVRENGLTFFATEILAAGDSKQVIFNALMSTLENGDEVIMAAPYFVSCPDMVRMLGSKPVTVTGQRSNGFKLTPELLEIVIASSTKWLILNTPSNPSGAVYDEEELQALGEVLSRHSNVLVLSDEIHKHILFDGLAFTPFDAACPQLRDHTPIVNRDSKACAMTGWRIGCEAGPAKLISALATVQSHSTTSACSIAQATAVATLAGPRTEVDQFHKAFKSHHNLLFQGINAIDGLSLHVPKEPFYAYIDCLSLVGKFLRDIAPLDSDKAVAKFLLDEAHGAAVPVSAHGRSPFFRISAAASGEKPVDAVACTRVAVSKLG